MHIVLLKLKIISIYDNWRNIDLANALQISPSEVSEALNRCMIARLIDSKKRGVHINSFREFLVYGLKYVFPVEPGMIVKGIPTAHSAPPISNHISSGKDIYVWKSNNGKVRGQSIEPLYKLPDNVLNDQLFYELLVIVDTIRIGRVREINIAIKELDNRLYHADI